MERRSFIKKGIVGSALFGLKPLIPTSNAYSSTGLDSNDYLKEHKFVHLDEEDLKFFMAICPIMLGQVSANDEWPPKKIVSSVVIGVDKAIGKLSLPAQNDLSTLFKLISFRPTRFMLTGVWSNWDSADYNTINNAMDKWSVASTELWRSAYEGLRELILASWYANPVAWKMIGYPGPPKI